MAPRNPPEEPLDFIRRAAALRERLSRQFPDGPWSKTAIVEILVDHNKEKISLNPAQERSEEEVLEVLDLVKNEYARPLSPPPRPTGSSSNEDSSYPMEGYDLRSNSGGREQLLNSNDLSRRLQNSTPLKRYPKGDGANIYRDMPVYQYTSLPAGNFTCVIALRPAENIGDELSYSIEILDLDHQHYKYDAVSYV